MAVMAVEGVYRGAGGMRWPYSPSEMLNLGVFFTFTWRPSLEERGQNICICFVLC